MIFSPKTGAADKADVEGSFRFEYLKQVTLGRSAARRAKFRQLARDSEDGFTVCGGCGVVRPPRHAPFGTDTGYYNQRGRQED
jgi:hypothetical protein